MKEPTSLRALVPVAVCVLALAALASQGVALADSPAFSRIIVFGDSVSDTGRYYQLSSEAWGAENAYPPSPPWFNHRFSNGPVWVEYLAEDLGMRGLLDDYAVGGASSGRDNSTGWFGGVQDQIDLYLSSNEGDPNALYILYEGYNDIFITLAGYPGHDPAAFAANTKQNLRALWAAGARHILVVNLTDLGKNPPVDPDTSGFLRIVTASYNAALAGALAELAATDHIRAISMDNFAFLDSVMESPMKFGFSNWTEDPFPGDATGYVVFGGHPSTQLHQLTAQFVERCLIDYYSPSRGRGMPPARLNALRGLVRAGKGS